MTAKGDNSVKIQFSVIAQSQGVSLITDVKFDIILFLNKVIVALSVIC